MREMIHFLAMALVVLVAAVCVLVQVSQADHAFSNLHQDDRGSIQEVSSHASAGR